MRLLERMEKRGVKEKEEAKLRSELADTQARLDKGLGYLEAHSAREPKKSDPKYRGWLDTFLGYTERYHELVIKERELLTEIEKLNTN